MITTNYSNLFSKRLKPSSIILCNESISYLLPKREAAERWLKQDCTSSL